MAIPSSPPLPARELSSPPPDGIFGYQPRKRHYAEYDSLSSDPVFSEDASESDEQTGVKKKRLFKGPWWVNTAFAPRTVAEDGKTKVPEDSGVWLGSESSGVNSVMGDQYMYDRVSMRGSSPPLLDEEEGDTTLVQEQVLPSAEDLATRIILQCVEQEDQTIDLTDMGLNYLSTEAVRPLHHLILAKSMDRAPAGSFVQLIPELRIYLSKNNLRTVPRELWNLENIAVLSLRNNDLKELPEWVGGLKKLKELNIATNQIRTLPCELLGMLIRRSGEPFNLTTHPNPLCQVADPTGFGPREPFCLLTSPSHVHAWLEQLRMNETSSETPLPMKTVNSAIANVAVRWLRRKATGHSHPTAPIYAASSEVVYFEFDGRPVRQQPIFGPNANAPSPHTALLHPSTFRPGRCDNAPSLFELAVRSCRDSPYLSQLPSFLPVDAPEPAEIGLRFAMDSKEQGLSRCSVCQGTYIIKRAEWIEYWFCDNSVVRQPVSLRTMLPFTRKACSWGCAARAIRDRNANIEDENLSLVENNPYQ